MSICWLLRNDPESGNLGCYTCREGLQILWHCLLRPRLLDAGPDGRLQDIGHSLRKRGT